MLRDITIGQHFPGNSLVHKFDPRLKLVLTIAYIILLFAASNPLGLALSILFLVGMYAVAKIPFKLILKSLKPILPIVVFTAVLNLFFGEIFLDIRISFNVGLEVCAFQPASHSVALYPFVSILTQYTFGNESD